MGYCLNSLRTKTNIYFYFFEGVKSESKQELERPNELDIILIFKVENPNCYQSGLSSSYLLMICKQKVLVQYLHSSTTDSRVEGDRPEVLDVVKQGSVARQW